MPNTIRKSIAQQIVATVHDVCGYDVNFIDTKGIIYASTNATRIGTYHEAGAKVARTGQILEVTEADNYEGTQMGINLPFSYHGQVIGVIGLSGVPEAVRKFGYLAQRITRLILKEQEQNILENNTNSMLHYCLHALAQGETLDSEYYQQFLATFKIDAKLLYRCVLVRIKEQADLANYSLLGDRIYHSFANTESKLYTYDYPHDFILLLTEKQWRTKHYLLEKLGVEIGNAVKIGIGFAAELAALHKSYAAAQIALNSFSKDSALVCFDDLSLEILLDRVDVEVKQIFLKKTIGELGAAESTLLQSYFTQNCSLKETSAKLYLHQNTVQYKLNRIASLTGYNPRNFQDAVVLYLGILLRQRDTTTGEATAK